MGGKTGRALKVAGETLIVAPAAVAALGVPGLALYAPTGLTAVDVAGLQTGLLCGAAVLSWVGLAGVALGRRGAGSTPPAGDAPPEEDPSARRTHP